MAPFSIITTSLAEIESISTSVKETFPSDSHLQSLEPIEIFNIFSSSERVLQIDSICSSDPSLNRDYIKALWVAHCAEMASNLNNRGVKHIVNMEGEDGEVEFYDLSKTSGSGLVDQLESTNRGKELLSLMQTHILMMSIGGTISYFDPT